MTDPARDRDHLRLDRDDDPHGHAPPPAAGAEPDPTETGGEGAPEPAKAELGKRFVAAVIDAVASVLVGMVPVVGGLVAAAYWLCRDGLDVDFLDGRSLGKKLVKLRPVRDDGLPMDLATSARRNWMFALGGVIQVLLFIPIVGWLLVIPVALVALALGVAELVLVVTDPRGRRLGDRMAGTTVVETND